MPFRDEDRDEDMRRTTLKILWFRLLPVTESDSARILVCFAKKGLPVRVRSLGRVERAITEFGRRVEVLIKVVLGHTSGCYPVSLIFKSSGGMGRTPWGLRQSAVLSRLHNHPGYQTGPTSLVRSPDTSTIVSVEELHMISFVPCQIPGHDSLPRRSERSHGSEGLG